MEIGIKTDVGKVRDSNQDSYYISPSSDYPLFMIADGMGGHKAGETASKLAIKIIRENLEKALTHEDTNVREIKDKIKKSIYNANNIVFKKSKENEEFSGMGTTITLAFIKEGKAYIGHAGDSRAYIYRDNKLSQITTDHSLVEELIQNGSISKEEGRNHPQKNIITRALGTSKDIVVDLIVESMEQGDILLLCTDGLTNALTDNEIKKSLVKYDNLQILCEELVKHANNKGGFDNTTVLAVKL